MVELIIAALLANTPPTPVKAPEPAPKEAPAAVAEKKPEAKVELVPPKPDLAPRLHPAPEGEAPPPPPLTRKALCGELTRTSKELTVARKRLDDDRKALESERAELERLKAEITSARAGLRVDTEKLEAILAKRGDAPAGNNTEAAKPAPKPTPIAPRPQELDGLAKTMKSMKPDAAAALIQRTEPTLAAALLKRMKPADAGAVMDRLKPELAADLVTLMSTTPAAAPTKPGGRL